MGFQTADQFPDPFDMVKLRDIGRKIVKMKMFFMGFEPGLEQPCVLPTGIIHDHNHFLSFRPSPEKIL